MEIVKILGVDPSLRNTGLSVVSYNTQMAVNDPKAFKVEHCQVLVNPPKYTGTEAILNMIDMLNAASKMPCYQEVDHVLVESPAAMYNPKFPTSIIAALGHISGAAVALLGIEKGYLFRPSEWNKTRKKDVTYNLTTAFLGEHCTWHFEKKVKSEKLLEHIMDATSMALWWIKQNYIEE